MPYQPTNPYPYNMAIDLKEGLQFRFKVDNYDVIESFTIELYDLLKNKKLYTIIRTIGTIQFSGSFELNDNTYNLTINEIEDTIILSSSYGSITSVMFEGTREEFQTVLLSYSVDLQNKIQEQLSLSSLINNQEIVEGDIQLIQILNENEETILLKEYTDDNYKLPIQGGLGSYSFGEVDVSHYLMTIEAIEKKQYYGDTNDYETLTVTNLECFVIDENGKIVEYIEDNNETDKNNIVIPYRTETGPIKNIGDNVFINNLNIQTVVIPSSITTIGAQAFQGCEALESVSLNYGVSVIGNFCFKDCIKLEHINLLDSIYSIGQGAFQNCEQLSYIRLPWSLELISANAFEQTGITQLSLPSEVNIIKEKAFLNCKGLKTVECNDKLEKIELQAFCGCDNLETITLKENLSFLGEEVFLDCQALTEITIPKNTQTILQGILKGCNSLQSLTVPFIGSTQEDNYSQSSVLGHLFGIADSSQNAIVQIYDDTDLSTQSYNIPESLQSVIITNALLIPCGAFSNCKSIQTVQMNNDINRIEGYAFYNCVSINKIELPSEITYIGKYAFALEEYRV